MPPGGEAVFLPKAEKSSDDARAEGAPDGIVSLKIHERAAKAHLMASSLCTMRGNL
jgi:hypothetical protein